jgi:hypothetical protein
MEDLANVIWEELKRYINTVDRADAAENLVSILVDNDSDPKDIKTAFSNDKDIKNALASYFEEEEQEEEEPDEEDIVNDDEWEN